MTTDAALFAWQPVEAATPVPTVSVTGCCCGQEHQVDGKRWQRAEADMAGEPVTITVRVGDGPRWRVPRLYLALHGLAASTLDRTGARYGWEHDHTPADAPGVDMGV